MKENRMTYFAQINVKWNMNWNTIENEKNLRLTLYILQMIRAKK